MWCDVGLGFAVRAAAGPLASTDARADALVAGDVHLLDLRAIIPVMTPAQFRETLPDR